MKYNIVESNFSTDNINSKIYVLQGNDTVNIPLDELNKQIENLPINEKVIDFFPGPNGEDLIETKVQ